MYIARRFLVSGRVQGVGFRWFIKDTADQVGASGWAQNLPDGRVEALVEGESAAVVRVEAAIRQGPRGGRVDDVAAFDEPAGGGHRGFQIRH